MKISAQNFTSQAIVALGKLAARFAQRGLAQDHALMQGLIGKLSSGVNFALPDNGRVFADDFRGLADLELRLPFPCVTLEYAVPERHEDVVQGKLVYSPKRVIMAMEVSADDASLNWLPASLAANVRKTIIVQEPELRRGILVAGVSALEMGAELQYTPEMAGWLLPVRYPDEESLATIAGRASEDGRIEMLSGRPLLPRAGRVSKLGDMSGVIIGYPVLLLEETLAFGRGTRDPATLERLISGLSRDIGQEAGAVLEFIEACSCSNVRHEILQAAPKPAVAQRRARDGKAPILETRTLVLDLPGVSRQAIDASNASGRLGPRQHLRRGHIRRLESGKRVWVQSAVVGGERSGVIDKQYIIKPRSAV